MTEEPAVHRTGRRGEDAAAGMVTARGWRIVGRNRRMTHGEADIVGLRERSGVQQGLVVEVKATRRHDEDLAARVTTDKRRRMFAMAEQLSHEHGLDEVHVVIIGAHLNTDSEDLLWLELDPF